MTAEVVGGTKSAAKPMLEADPSTAMKVTVWLFVTVPFIALLAALPFAWLFGWGPSILDIVMIVILYSISCSGVGIGFHRYLTHGSFHANRTPRILLAAAGSLAAEGPVIQWVADHRRHHAFADREGDPHSPWLYGETVLGIAKGFWHAHMGWIFNRQLSNRERFTPDLLADRDIQRVDSLFPWLVVVTFLTPAAVGGLVTWSWQGAVLAFFWAGLVRVSLLHHVTWSINSICHMVGNRPFTSRDKATNFWPLAIFSFGEAWHNLHHADPTCARHGVQKGQIDINARMIWVFERFGWAYNVRWPTPARLRRLEKSGAAV